MRKLIFSIPITLDGFIEGPHRELDWVIPDDELHDFYADMLRKSDLILYGRVTYELMLSYWPNAPADPTISPGMLRFADALNPLKKIVYSKTLKDVKWNTTILDSYDPGEIKNLKSQPGRDIL
jgi:dihydrofolate reductase